ncbi:MAG: tetratricopeptide (TPR) repeat protein [Lysobacterales bacterium]|jgi:tetratricopeptide (TPR) repeat protein
MSNKVFITSWFFVICVIGLLIYLPAYHAPFQLDDYFTIILNPVIQNLSRLDHMWLYDPSRFITHVTFAINFAIGQLNPLGYHVVNVLIHIANASLVFTFILLFRKRMKICLSATVFSVLIFLMHPIQTSAVTYVAQRSTLLTFFFYLSTIILFWQYRQSRKSRYYILSLIATLLGCLCKPIMITVPFALILVDLCFSERNTRRWNLFVPYLTIVLSIPLFLSFWRYQTIDISTILSITREADVLTRSQYLYTQFHVIWKYIQLVFIPVGQNLDYDFPIYASFFNQRTVLAFTGLLGIFIYALKVFPTKRLISFCILWIFITLALESSVFPIRDVIFEHRLYIPMLGFSLLLGHAPGAVINKYPRSKYLFLALLIGLATLTIQRNYVWADRIRLLEDVAMKSPNKMRVLNNLSVAYAEEGRFDKAINFMHSIIQRFPYHPEAVNNLANTLRKMGRFEEAIEYYNQLIAADPHNGASYYFRSQCYYQLRDYKQAYNDAHQAKRLDFSHIGVKYINSLEELISPKVAP